MSGLMEDLKSYLLDLNQLDYSRIDATGLKEKNMLYTEFLSREAK